MAKVNVKDGSWPKWFIEKAKVRRKDWMRWRLKQIHPLAVELAIDDGLGKEIWDMAVMTTLDLLKKESLDFSDARYQTRAHLSLWVRMNE